MEHMGYEPFGERLVSERDTGPPSPVSRYLLWAGTGLFWSLVGAIVLARAAYFEPGFLTDSTAPLRSPGARWGSSRPAPPLPSICPSR